MKKYLFILLSLGYIVGINPTPIFAQSTNSQSEQELTAEEMYKLGLDYYLVEDYENAIIWFTKAAEFNNAASQYYLGVCYYEGDGVSQDYKQALYWFMLAEKYGGFSTAAKYYIAMCYQYGHGVSQDYAKAYELYEQLANVGDVYGLFSLGLYYYYGYGDIKQNYAEATYYFRKAKERKHPFAQEMLDRIDAEMAQSTSSATLSSSEQTLTAKEMFYKGYEYLQNEDYTEALKWFRKSAEQGAISAQHNLGVMYYRGQGVSQDYSEAAKWYRKAAEQGYHVAQNALGYMYEYGRGVSEDYAEAARWYRKAAEQGFAEAQYNLGYMYQYGRGVSEDYSEAVRWYHKAAEQGLAKAQTDLGTMYSAGEGVSQDYVEALKWFRKAAEQGHGRAYYLLGDHYYFGRGGEKDLEEAEKWLRKILSQDNANEVLLIAAKALLGEIEKEKNFQ